MEESGVTKVISVRLENEDRAAAPVEQEPWDEEEVEIEDGRELPLGVDDPALVSEAELRPIRAAHNGTTKTETAGLGEGTEATGPADEKSET
jgi:chromosome segregation protein